MMQPQALPWCEPIELAKAIQSPTMALLYSSAHTSYSGARSLLAVNLEETADIHSFDDLSPLLAHHQPLFDHAWFGFLGYDMRHDVERYTPARGRGYKLPRGRLMRFADIYEFDHEKQSLTLWSEMPARPIISHSSPAEPSATVSSLSSNMTRGEYEQKVMAIIEAIRAGDLYQANLTRKFYGQWDSPPNGLGLFSKLCHESPAPYSAYLRMPDAEILSSSPEQFLCVTKEGKISSRPIKGTAPRGKSAQEDTVLQDKLKHSRKNQAENLMITDLMRHDLAQSCDPGSIQVKNLFEVTPHATIFHMASTVTGQKKEHLPLSELLRHSFPPGSMTGAPKIRAVELCTQLEGNPRGVYSGAIGWFGGDGSAELSVVIRTVIIQGNHFEFQVGGGIVADSTPAGEWAETMDKAMGILNSLGIDRTRLEVL